VNRLGGEAVTNKKEEEEDFDSYFDDFGDESFELALSQLDNIESSRDGLVKEDSKVDSIEGEPEKETEPTIDELARKELEGLADLSDWGSDEDF
jgi:hypothetical protein